MTFREQSKYSDLKLKQANDRLSAFFWKYSKDTIENDSNTLSKSENSQSVLWKLAEYSQK